MRAVSGERPTPPNGVQLIDRSQWRAIAAVAVVAALALCCALAAHLRPRPSRPQPAPVVHVAPPTYGRAGCAL